MDAWLPKPNGKPDSKLNTWVLAVRRQHIWDQPQCSHRIIL